MIHETLDTTRIPAAGTDISMIGVETVYCDNDGAPQRSSIVSLLRLLKRSRSDRTRASQQAA